MAEQAFEPGALAARSAAQAEVHMAFEQTHSTKASTQGDHGAAPGVMLRPSLHSRSRYERRLAAVWFWALAAARVYRRLMLLERRLDEPMPDVPLPSGVAVKRLRLEDLSAYLCFRPDADPAELRRRFGEGEWSFAAWLDGRIVSAAWTAPRRARIAYLDWELPLASDEAYSHDLYTAPGFRGRGIAGSTRTPALRHARDRGYRRLLSAILPENTAGWRTPEVVGYRHIGWVGYVGLGPLRCHFCRLALGASGPGTAHR